MSINNLRKRELIESLASCIDIGENSEEHFKNIREKGKQLDQDKDLKHVEKFFTALSNDVRLKILKILRQKSRCVCELEIMLDKSQPTVSHHLRILEEINLVRGYKQGRFTHYEVIENKLEEQLEFVKYVFDFSQ